MPHTSPVRTPDALHGLPHPSCRHVWSADAIYIIDMLLQFITMQPIDMEKAQDTHQDWEMDLRVLAKNYLLSWFVIDFWCAACNQHHHARGAKLPPPRHDERQMAAPADELAGYEARYAGARAPTPVRNRAVAGGGFGGGGVGGGFEGGAFGGGGHGVGDRRVSTRVNAPPGGTSSICFG